MRLILLLLTSHTFAFSQWQYGTIKDGMGRNGQYAAARSVNSFELRFPYGGEQRATLQIEKLRGTDVTVSIDKGQIICGITDCWINVRFDSGKIRRFVAIPSSDMSNRHLFIRPTFVFMSQLRKAKKVVIEPTIYQEGPKPLEFNVGGFNWPDH